jgi:hypothetical protein
VEVAQVLPATLTVAVVVAEKAVTGIPEQQQTRGIRVVRGTLEMQELPVVRLVSL